MPPQAKAERPLKKEAKTTVKLEEIASPDEEDEAVEDIARTSHADEECLALERQPSVTWVDIAHQSFLPRTMHRSRTCGLVLPWQLVLEHQRGSRSPALDVVVSAASLQAFAREAPEDVRERLVVEGAGQYGKSLRLVNALLKNEATVRLFSYTSGHSTRSTVCLWTLH